MPEIKVIKYAFDGSESYSYHGELRSHNGAQIVVAAPFGMQRNTIHGIPMKLGDLFIETYYTDRWYNTYEVHDVDDGSIKFWYCNVAYPAKVKDGLLTFRDLALDLFVYPDGKQEVLDEDEFAALVLTDEERAKAIEGLGQLQALFRERFGK